MLHKNRVFGQYRRWRDSGEDIVLACVVATSGSTYTKPGDFILLTAGGRYQGLVSGGCVEGDLLEHARSAATTSTARLVHYDLGSEEDVLWGMGAGCEGALTVLLQPLSVPSAAAAIEAIASAYDSGDVSDVAVSGTVDAPNWSVRALARGASIDAPAFDVSGDRIDGRFAVQPAPRVLVCGAGVDAEPVLALAGVLGWHSHAVDHRPAYSERLAERFAGQVQTVSPAGLPLAPTPESFDAVVIMSHHLESDARYLAAVAGMSHWSYVGLLGPKRRRQRLLERVPQASSLASVLDGPAGVDIGGREPASIALSICAAVHAGLARSGVIPGAPGER